jgi:hypothetical protein
MNNLFKLMNKAPIQANRKTTRMIYMNIYLKV